MWCSSTMDDGNIFKLTLLARVNFTPHKPYIVAKHEWSLSYDVQLWLVSYGQLMPSLTGQFWVVTVFYSLWLQCSLTSFYNAALHNSFASLHTTSFKTHVRAWSKIYTTASHTLGHPYLVSLVSLRFMASLLYSTCSWKLYSTQALYCRKARLISIVWCAALTRVLWTANALSDRSVLSRDCIL